MITIAIPRITRRLLLFAVAAAIIVGAADRAGAHSVASPLPLTIVNSALYSFGDIGSNDGTVFGRNTTTVHDFKGGKYDGATTDHGYVATPGRSCTG